MAYRIIDIYGNSIPEFPNTLSSLTLESLIRSCNNQLAINSNGEDYAILAILHDRIMVAKIV